MQGNTTVAEVHEHYVKLANHFNIGFDALELVPKSTGNPFKVGDRVRRIRISYFFSCPINSEHIVKAIDESQVYYMDGFASHYRNFELVTPASGKGTIFGAAPTNACKEVPLTTVATPCSLPQPIPEEETMNENISITMTAAEYAKHQKQSKVSPLKTNLEARKPCNANVYNVAGTMVDSFGTKSEKALDKLVSKYLANPANIGKTIVISKEVKTVTTDIPLVTTKS